MNTANIARFHALDNLRGLLMWLGIVLHVAVIYTVQPIPQIPWHDRSVTPVADLLLITIHSFRMPAFFILAGFFTMLLVQNRELRGMLKNRLKRLALPFVVFWLPLTIAVLVSMLWFLHLAARGTWGLDMSLIPSALSKSPSTMHLWFIWMLWWLCVALAFFTWATQKIPLAKSLGNTLFRRLTSTGWAFLLLALPQAWVGSFYPNGLLAPTGAFLIPANEWVQNGLFFCFGCTLFVNQQQALHLYQRRWHWYASAGVLLFVGALLILASPEQPFPPNSGKSWLIAYLYNCTSWLWSLALIGLTLRYAHKPYAWLTYLARSSYWVYLVHFPCTIALGAILYQWQVPALIKIFINILGTTGLCLISYQVLVRDRAIGRMLNGR